MTGSPRSTRWITRFASFASTAALAGSLAFAQQTPPPAAPGGPAQGGQNGGPAMGPGQGMQMHHEHGGDPRDQSMRGGGMRSEGRIVPPGMWWKNPELVQRIGLTADQTQRMEDIFQKSRIQLIDLKANVEKQEVTLEPMLDANPIDARRTLAQIGKVADARAELEKANAGMLLGIRGVLTPEQWTKLQAAGRGHGRPAMGRLEGPGSPTPSGMMADLPNHRASLPELPSLQD